MKNILLSLFLFITLIESALAQNKKDLFYDNWSVTVTTNDRNKVPASKKGDFTTNFVAVGTQWDHRVLTYFFQNGTPDITNNDERQSIRNAFGLWTAQTDLVFLEVCTAAQADIVILWAARDHGDGDPFDGASPGGPFLAHGFFPPPTAAGAMAGDIHFDEDETWTTAARNSDAQPIDLESVAAHEIGHSLGLNHTSVAGSLMLPNYTSSHRFLGSDDIAGIQSIYGVPGGNNGNNLINGPTTLCLNSNTTYSIPNPQAGITFTWASSNPNLATINASTGVATSIANGTVTFTATANSGCGTITLSKIVTIGAPLTPRLDTYSSLDQVCWNANNLLNFFITAPQPGVTYTTSFIEVPSGYVVETLSGTQFNIRVGAFANGGSYNIVTVAQNSCDNTGNIRSTRTMHVQSCGGGGGGRDRVAMYPNPATNSVDFSLQDEADIASNSSSSTSAGFQVAVYDSQGQLRWQSNTHTSTLHLDSSHLPRGLYKVIINENDIYTRRTLSLE